MVDESHKIFTFTEEFHNLQSSPVHTFDRSNEDEAVMLGQLA